MGSFVGELCDREQSKQEICMERHFTVDVCINVGEADENWISKAVTTHDGDIHLVQ